MGEWIERRGMQTPRHDLAAVAVEDRIFAMGGAYGLPGEGYKWLHDMHEYVP